MVDVDIPDSFFKRIIEDNILKSFENVRSTLLERSKCKCKDFLESIRNRQKIVSNTGKIKKNSFGPRRGRILFDSVAKGFLFLYPYSAQM